MKQNTIKLPLFLAAVLVLTACVPEPPKPMKDTGGTTEPMAQGVELKEVITETMDLSVEDLADAMQVPKELLEATPTEEEAQEMLDRYNALDPADRDDVDMIGDILKETAIVTKTDLEKKAELVESFSSRQLEIQDSYGRMRDLCGLDITPAEFDQAMSFFYNREAFDLDSILNLSSNTREWTADEEIQVLQIITRSTAGTKEDLQAGCRNLFADLKDSNFGEGEDKTILAEERAFEMPASEMERMIMTEQLEVQSDAIIIEGRDVNGNVIEGIIDESNLEYFPPTPGAFPPEVAPDPNFPTAEELGLEEGAVVTQGTAVAEESMKIGGNAGLFSEEEMAARHQEIDQFMANTPSMVNVTFSEVIDTLCEVELEPVPAGIFVSRIFVERDNSFQDVMAIYQNETLSDEAKQSQILSMVLDPEENSTVADNVAACQALIAELPTE